MPRLIDADKLRKDILDLSNCYNGFSDTYDKAYIIDVIDEQPTVNVCPYWDNESDYCALNKPSDAEPVVRCKDCEYWVETDVPIFHLCARGMTITTLSANDYCSRGKRKEDAERMGNK